MEFNLEKYSSAFKISVLHIFKRKKERKKAFYGPRKQSKHTPEWGMQHTPWALSGS